MPTKVPITTRLLGRSMSGHAADAVSGQKVPPPSNESTSKQSSSEHVLVVDKSKELSVAPQQPSSIRRANSLPTHTTEGSAGNNNEHRAMSATAILSTSNAEVQAGETTHFSDHSDTDVCSPQTPSSPSTQLKKKKNKKKKKKRKTAITDDSPANEQEPSEDQDQIQRKNSFPQVGDLIDRQQMKIQKGLDLSEVAMSSSGPTATAMVIKSKLTVAEKAETFVHEDEMNSRRSCLNTSDNHSEKIPERIISDATSKTSVDESEMKDISDIKVSGPSVDHSSPSKREHLSIDKSQSSDPDDGAWETVEVKTKGRRRKATDKQSSSPSEENNGQSSNSITSKNNGGGRSHNNNDNAYNNGGGRSHNNNDNAYNNGGGRSHNNNDNNASVHHAEGGGPYTERKKKHRNRGHHRDRNRGNDQQHNKMIKDIILDIIDAVGDDVVRLGLDVSTQPGNAVSVGDNNLSGKSDKHSSSTSINKRITQQHHSNDEQRRGRSNSVAASSTRESKPSMTSNLSLGALPAAAGVPPNKKAASKSSSKVKPGLSYKSVIEPPADVDAVSPPQPQHPKPKPNAWSKPPLEIKAKLDIERKSSVEVKRPDIKPEMVALADITPVDKKDERSVPVVDHTEEEAQQQRRMSVSVTDDEGAAPPLSTLIGPGNACSASSSVASSLEAPHSSSNRFCQSSSATTEDDVGYHLLNVCGRMSEEITTFMSRRALALDVRRKERNAVLHALGESLGKIWPGQCRVQMYGSCATQLDLPSSDLDLVVCGLDDVVLDHIIPAPHLHHTPIHSFAEHEETTQEFVSTSQGNNQASLSPQSSTVDNQQYFASGRRASGGSNLDTGGGDNASLDQDARKPDENEQTTMQLNENIEHTYMGREYSSGTVTSENYSHEYEPKQLAEAPVMDVSYSPAYSYHSHASLGYDVEENTNDEGYTQEYQNSGQEFYYTASPYSYVSSVSLNAQRVIRLAAELELQPWAVQVKAIPTATVPVVKLLADPSKLPGFAVTGGNWMMHQHIAVQAGITVAGTPPPPPVPEQLSASQHGPNVPSQSHFLPQWRGADIMNGLQPVDITFDGPEHGGIGSTTYSARVVKDACEELGLAPESTPVVQVASVLKELLAQRRLNEPFSGGLSSYGLLLLLLAVLKDRRIIQQEMLKFGKTSSPTSASLVTASTGQSDTSPGEANSNSISPSTASKPIVSSSWASIAKKSNNTAITESSTLTKSTIDSARTTGLAMNKSDVKQINERKNKDMVASIPNHFNDPKSQGSLAEKKQNLSGVSAVTSQVTPSSEAPSSKDDNSKQLLSSSAPQGSNDILEVLCSGELTSGKLLMHFLLFYGHHFDARSTLIDINGTHHSEYGTINLERLSPFVPRPPGGTIDPITGMFSVDQIVVYDPLEGAIDHNVTKRCYCWNNVKWVFAQCYMTVSQIVETSDTKDATNGTSSGSIKTKDEQEPILEHFLSF